MVTKEYQAKSAYAQADLHQSFLEMHCAKGGDVWELLGNLCYKQEELAASGVDITDKEYEHTILQGIPTKLATFASHILFSAHLIHGATSINTDALINQICEEAEQLKIQCGCRQSSQGGKKEAIDEALAVTNPESGKKRCCKGKYHNCGKTGHWVKECHSPKKDKDESAGTQAMQMSSSKPENKPVGSANTAIVHDFNGNGFWMVEEAAINLAPLIIAEPDPLLGALNDPEVVLHWEGEETMLEEELAGAAITQVDETQDNWICIELYDSGITHHISPYKSNFISYAPLIPPVFLNMANQQQFSAIGCGTLAIQVPNRDREIKLTLHRALHAPGISYTLVSLATLDKEGYYAHIGASHLDLTFPQGEKVGRITRTSGCLYKVVHALNSTNAVEPVSVMEL
jgi:Pol polyprotein/LTR polyprotein gag-polypeptide-like protein